MTTYTCRVGHQSTDHEFCEVCGIKLDQADNAATRPTTSISAAAACQACGARLYGRFCEACGQDTQPGAPQPSEALAEVEEPAPAPPRQWTATVTADRARYDAVVAADGNAPIGPFPDDAGERTYLLRGEQVSIGRRSVSRGITPDIDLGESPEDFGVSHLHAVLIPRQNGEWAVVDVGSTNGTALNKDEYPLRVNVPQPLADGDQIVLGAWTVIIIEASVPAT